MRLGRGPGDEEPYRDCEASSAQTDGRTGWRPTGQAGPLGAGLLGWRAVQRGWDVRRQSLRHQHKQLSNKNHKPETTGSDYRAASEVGKSC